MVGRWSRILAALAVLVGVLPMEGRAQPLGGFSFQLAPYCNVVTLSVRQDGSVYTLDGYDNQCGASARASASGMAFLNPNGTIGIGLTIVLPPGGASVHVDASIDPSTLAFKARVGRGFSPPASSKHRVQNERVICAAYRPARW